MSDLTLLGWTLFGAPAVLLVLAACWCVWGGR